MQKMIAVEMNRKASTAWTNVQLLVNADLSWGVLEIDIEYVNLCANDFFLLEMMKI